MAHPLPGSAESLQAYPNMTDAAAILGISTSTLSRRDDLADERRGERDRVLPPAEVLRLAAVFRRRSLNDVAQALLDHASKRDPEAVARIEREIDRFFEDRGVGAEEREHFVALARRLLPAKLSQQIEVVLEEKGDELPDVIHGYPPAPAD